MSTAAGARSHRSRVLLRRLDGPRAILWQVALTVGLLPWIVQPGLIEPDTKVDLVVSPGRYLGRALSAWSVHSGFGELQNQAYGYLFPMGPIFWVAHTGGVPAWATQRVWWMLLLVVACAGASRVARDVLGLGVLAASVAGVGYALSPRVLTLLSELSVEAWPGALLPWFVVAVQAHLSGRLGTRRFVGVVGVLAATCGGVNATASLVPILGAGIFLVLRGARVRQVVCYLLGTLLGAAWWIGPLVVLGGYAYPFMDYIETARITTAVTSVPGILRGASDWVAYLIDATDHPVWQSGWVVAQSTMSIIGGLVLAGLGLYGLADTRGRSAVARSTRVFSALLVLGVVGMGIAYVGGISGPFAAPVRTLLDGPLAAARNVHKADPLVRLPLVLGVALVVERAGRRSVAALAVVVVAGGATLAPFWQGRLGDAAGVAAYPSSLIRTAHLVDTDDRVRGGSTLVLPSARSAAATWGTSTDEPLTAFAASPIAWRASAPLVHPGAQRLMDAVDADVAAGRDLAAVASALSRAGVTRIVVRHGLTAAEQTPPADLIVRHLAAIPSAFPKHTVVGSGPTRYDLFEVAGPGPLRAAQSVGVLGGPESTLTLAAAGLRAGVPTITGRSGGWITDDIRKRVDNNGRPPALAFGPTLPAADTSDARLGARDLDFPGRAAALTTLSLVGLDGLTASASAADPFGSVYLGPGAGPAAAIDGDATTGWLTPVGTPGALTLSWNRGTPSASEFTIVPTRTVGARVLGWRVTLDGVTTTVYRAAPRLTVPAGTKRLTLAPLSSGGSAEAAVGIAELRSSGFAVLAAPLLPGRLDPTVNALVLTRATANALGRPLRGEDGTTWERLVRVSSAGTMNLWIQPTAGVSCSSIHIDLLDAHGHRHAATSGQCHRRITLTPGMNLVQVSGGDAVRLVLTPTRPTARAALGLTAAPAAGPTLTPLTTGANAGWVSSRGVHGEVVDGWQQAYPGVVPRASVRFAPQAWHVLALSAGGVCAFGVVALAAWPTRRRRVSDAERTLPSSRHACGSPRQGLAGVALAVMVAILLGGWWGVVAAGIALLVPVRWRAAAAAVLLSAAGPVLATLGVVDHASWGAFLGQLLGITALAAFVLACADAPRRWRDVRAAARNTTPARR